MRTLDPLLFDVYYEQRPGRPCREDRIYAAGLFDGEGSLSILPDKNEDGRPRHTLVARLGMCDLEPIAWLHDCWGGGLTRGSRDARNPGWRTSNIWAVSGWDAAAFLTDVRPFLKLERVKMKVTLALAFQAEKEAARMFDPEGPHFDRARARFPRYAAVMRELNTKGIAGETTGTLDEIFAPFPTLPAAARIARSAHGFSPVSAVGRGASMLLDRGGC